MVQSKYGNNQPFQKSQCNKNTYLKKQNVLRSYIFGQQQLVCFKIQGDFFPDGNIYNHMAKREPPISSFHFQTDLSLSNFGQTGFIIFEKVDKKRKCLLKSTLSKHLYCKVQFNSKNVNTFISHLKCLKVAQLLLSIYIQDFVLSTVLQCSQTSQIMAHLANATFPRALQQIFNTKWVSNNSFQV